MRQRENKETMKEQKEREAQKNGIRNRLCEMCYCTAPNFVAQYFHEFHD